MKKISLLAIITFSLFLVITIAPTLTNASDVREGKKGLNAVNVKVLSRDGSKPMWEWVQEHVVGREMVMPGDNVAGTEKAKALEAFVNARSTDPTDSDGDGYGNARIREGGHTIGAGIVAEIVKGIDGHHGENGDNMPPEEHIKKQEGTITIMKRLPDHSLGVIELRMKTGTVKFFNEKKGVDDGSQTDKGRSIPENSIEMIANTPNGDKVVNILKGKLP